MSYALVNDAIKKFQFSAFLQDQNKEIFHTFAKRYSQNLIF